MVRAVSLSDEQFRAVMGSFAAGVTVVTTRDAGGRPLGLTVTAFCSVSAAPPLCLVCLSHGASALDALCDSGVFAVNLLSQDQAELSRRFAGDEADRFQGLEIERGPETGCALLPEALGWLECRVWQRHPAGDHEVFIGELLSAGTRPGQPLAYFRGRYAVLAP